MDANRIAAALVDMASGAWEEVSEHLNLNPKRAVQYLGLFLVTSLVYASYLKGFIDHADQGSAFTDDAAFFFAALKCALSVGWPFLVLGALDKEWVRADAQRVAVAAYVVSLLFWLHRYNLNSCALGSLMLFVPLFFSAIAFHGLGTLRYRHHEE